jgi:oligopeptide/dipeptide ABC transporter ATP-binding protein
MSNILEVEHLKKYFPIRKGLLSKVAMNVKAVDDVSFSIEKGKTVGLVGESGCGKSTVGRTILNLINPTGGSVTFDGKKIYDIESNQRIKKEEMQQLRRDMQIIFQDPFACLDPRMTIGSIVTEGIKKHGIAKGKEALAMAEELLERCGLSKSIINSYPHEFSGGQRQRIGIARALSLKPKFIVCDEPTAALDVSIQSQVLNTMMQLKEDFKLTYLFISHDLSVVRYFCDEIIVMYLGEIVEKADAEVLFNEGLHPYTKALLSAIPKSDPTIKKERIILKGDVPSPANPPSGCKFHTRCIYAKDICKNEIPVYKEYGKGHFAMCHLIGKGEF